MGTDSGVSEWIDTHLGGKVVSQKYVGRSDWSSQYVYSTEDGNSYFVKLAPGHDEAMFKGEALALKAMHDTHTLKVPEVYHYGPLSSGVPGGGSLRGGGSFIIMEHLNLSGRPSGAEMGRQLALMHLATPLDHDAAGGKFGFPIDNTCGGTLQPNAWQRDWVTFFRDQRLMHQLKLTGNRELMDLGEKLCNKLDTFFEGIEVKPSILHGDLWSGNIAAADGQPCIFDPASYYGHHEAEFGISWCAGFSQDFWTAYHEVIPRQPGFKDRHQIYQLYHYLNHYNLFGSGYLAPCINILKQYVK